MGASPGLDERELERTAKPWTHRRGRTRGWETDGARANSRRRLKFRWVVVNPVKTLKKYYLNLVLHICANTRRRQDTGLLPLAIHYVRAARVTHRVCLQSFRPPPSTMDFHLEICFEKENE